MGQTHPKNLVKPKNHNKPNQREGGGGSVVYQQLQFHSLFPYCLFYIVSKFKVGANSFLAGLC